MIKVRKTWLNAHHNKFLDAKEEVDSTIFKAKLDYEANLINDIKTDPKSGYNYARHFARSSSTVDILENDGVSYKTPADKYFSLPTKNTENTPKKVFVKRTRTQLAGNFYSNRVVDTWNKLPEDIIISALTVSGILQ